MHIIYCKYIYICSYNLIQFVWKGSIDKQRTDSDLIEFAQVLRRKRLLRHFSAAWARKLYWEVTR